MKDNSYLVVQVTATQVEFALFDGLSLLDVHAMDKQLASKQFLIALETMLSHAGVALHHLRFIAATVGPAPITTLRAILATLNGIHFATKIPLIPVDGMSALLHMPIEERAYTIGLVNAYNNDLFYGVMDSNNVIVSKGWGQGTAVLAQLAPYAKQKTVIVGSGVALFSRDIRQLFPHATILPIEQPSIEQVAMLAQQQVAGGNTSEQLLPTYVKDFRYTPSVHTEIDNNSAS